MGGALDLSLDVVQRCLDKLDAAGIIAERGRRYELVQALTVDTRALGKLREHWAAVAAERVRVPRPDDIFSYNVLSGSRADMERIDALLRATFREIRMIVANTSEDEVAALVNLQDCPRRRHGAEHAPPVTTVHRRARGPRNPTDWKCGFQSVGLRVYIETIWSFPETCGPNWSNSLTSFRS